MRKISSVLFLVPMLLLLFTVSLQATDVRKLYHEGFLPGNESERIELDEVSTDKIPSPPKLNQIGTVLDSTIYDYQFSVAGRRIISLSDSALHIAAMTSPVSSFIERGMKYFYYINDVFTNFGYIEGNGTGDQRGGFGSIKGYYPPGMGIGNVAIMTSHTNLSGQALGSHWHSFQDAFQGVGAFTPYEGGYASGTDPCDAFMWPDLAIINDMTGSMAMVGVTQVESGCSGGFDDVKVMHKNFTDSEWSDPVLLDTLDDPTAWNAGPNQPRIVSHDSGYMVIASGDFGTNVYYWESTDGGATWSDRMDVTGFPIDAHVIPPDTSSDEYRPLQNQGLGMSPDGTPHIVWTAYQAQGILPDSMYTPGADGLWQYRTKLEHWDPVNGVNTIYRHPDGLANFAGGTQYFAYNIARPCIGFDESGEIIYVVHTGFVDADQDFSNGIYYGDIYASVSTDGGATWKDRVNITATTGSDDLFPTIAPVNGQGLFPELPGFSVGNADGVNDFIITYQNDDVAGTFLGGEEPSANWDMLLVAPVDLDTIPALGGIDNGGPGVSLPRSFTLNQNYPNPFNPSTSISYQLAEKAQVSIKIHNIRGQMVKKLVDGVKEAGEYSVQWDGRDEIGMKVSSGIYLYVLETDKGFKSTRKMVVLK
jgi:hypothetical protein